MEHLFVNKENIIRQLQYVPTERLKEIESYIQFILYKYKKSKDLLKEPKTLSGIWKNIGFEKIADIDNEISEIRSITSQQILKKDYLK